jgi:4'-phosphopantetheinyl transferase
MRTALVTFARFTRRDRADWLAAAARMRRAGERDRLAVISDPDLRVGHALGRALVRLIAAEASGHDPCELTFDVSDGGKPALQELPDLGFSVSHSGRVVAVATCEGIPVGIDVEQPRAIVPQPRRLAQRTFAGSEVAALMPLPDEPFDERFSEAWTIKEAVGKALGVGVVPALSGVVLDCGSVPLRLVRVDGGPPVESWTLHQLTAPGGCEKLAVALPAPGVALAAVAPVSLAGFIRRIDAQPAAERLRFEAHRRRAVR